MSITRILKKMLPKPVTNLLRDVKLRLRPKKSLEGIFTEIYEKKKWGDADKPFFSGNGSKESEILPYVNAVNSFIEEHGIKSIVDLGCGDFEVGRRLSEKCIYIGCDVVDPLIQYNRKMFASPRVSFKQCDITQDELPDGELCLVRQVFQHLSNDCIKAVLPKLAKFKYVIVADAQPYADKSHENMDIPSFSGTRAVIHGKGLWLESAPFNLPIKVLAEYRLNSDDDEYLRVIQISVK